jgi:alkylation response protein AidB-like acyl-CoA dehydrogenase
MFRFAFVDWIDEHIDILTPPFRDHGTTDELLEHQRRVQRLLSDAGWTRFGWPEAVGGLGGTPLFRAIVGEELTTRGLVHSSSWAMIEVLGPAVVAFAEPDLAQRVVPAMLRGDETWCQGFSEPNAGSDLGSLRTTARLDDGVWVISGEKLWTSWAHHAARCVVLARTEGDEKGSRGISAFFVDMDSPGVTVRPLQTMADVDEFCETVFDDVRVPPARMLGERGNGWAVTQYILACERGPIFWQRAGWLLHHLDQLIAVMSPDDHHARHRVGEAYARVFALRARSRTTQANVARGDLGGPATSIDKIMISAADQAVFDAARSILPGSVELGDSPESDRFRKEWLYSRAATIYGGTSEIQRDIVAARLLGLDAPR